MKTSYSQFLHWPKRFDISHDLNHSSYMGRYHQNLASAISNEIIYLSFLSETI